MAAPVPAKKFEESLPREVGGFRLVRELGRGGMGVVYEAQELSSGRVVALKVLVTGQGVSEEAFERFRRESRMAASISDSRCVFVYGAHQIDGAPAIAMELCPGETLEHRLEKGEPIAIDSAVGWTLDVLEGLEAAHKSGVVHRDVKPSNCFITHDGRVKVGDFGLSSSLDNDVRLTQSGAFLGSPLYASPEQVKGRDVDRRSDIYSCGATLYALLSGHPPHPGKNIGEVLSRILSEDPPPLRASRPDVTPELEKVIARAMERDPERRFQDHASFRAALEPFVAREVVAAGRMKRVVAFVLDQLLLVAVNSLIMFTALAQGWQWAEIDLTQQGRFRSVGGLLFLSMPPLLYFALCEGLAGATLGKWMLGLRVVDVRTGEPSLGRAFARSLAFFALSLVLDMPLHLSSLSYDFFRVGIALITVTNYAVLFSTIRHRNGYRGLHELASGTRVIQARSPFARFKDTEPVPTHEPKSAVGWPAVIGPYTVSGSIGATPSGALLECVDQNLNRKVWIYARKDATGSSSELRRSLVRPGRLRWLDSIREGDLLFEAFEAPGGASLSACVAQRASFDWPTAQRLLSGLADELAEVAQPVCIEQIWIDRTWSPRVLDEPIGAGNFALVSPLALLADATRLLLRDRDRPDAILPTGLPVSAEPVVRKLLGHGEPYANVGDASRDLKNLAGRPMRLRGPVRAAQIAMSAMVPAVVLMFPVGAMFVLSDPIDRFMHSLFCIRELQAQEADPPPQQRMDDDDRRARELVIADSGSNFWGESFAKQLDPAQLEIRQRAIQNHPVPSAEELAWARARIRERPFERAKPDAKEAAPSQDPQAVHAPLGSIGEVSVAPHEEKNIKTMRWLILPIFLAVAFCAWGVCSLFFSLILRGGLSLKLFGIGVRNRRGELASRLRCLWRGAMASVPLGVLYGVGAWLGGEKHLAAGLYMIIAALLIHASAVVYAIARPSRGIQDRLAGTHLVPR